MESPIKNIFFGPFIIPFLLCDWPILVL